MINLFFKSLENLVGFALKLGSDKNSSGKNGSKKITNAFFYLDNRHLYHKFGYESAKWTHVVRTPKQSDLRKPNSL